MPQYVTDAVVLHAMDFAESDRIVTFMTRYYGKVKGIAKGAKRSKKRFGINLEPLSHVRLHFFEKKVDSLVRISGCDLVQPFQGLRGDLFKIAYGSYMLELVEKMTAERERNPEMFAFLIYYLGILERGRNNEDMLRFFEVRLLDILGLKPHLHSCVLCRTPFDHAGRISVSPEKGGAICFKCSHGSDTKHVSAGTVRILDMALKMDKTKLSRLVFSRESMAESREILGDFITFYAGQRIKSLNFIDKIRFAYPELLKGE